MIKVGFIVAVRIQGVCDYRYLKLYTGNSLVLQREAVITRTKPYKGVIPEVIFLWQTLEPFLKH